MREMVANRRGQWLTTAVLALLVTVAAVSLGCSRPTPGQSELNREAVVRLSAPEKSLITDIYNSALASLTAGNDFKDLWDRKHSWLSLTPSPSDTQVIEAGNAYTDSVTKLRELLKTDSNKETLRNLARSTQEGNDRMFLEAWNSLQENLALAGGRTFSTLTRLNTDGRVLTTGSMTVPEIEVTTFKTHDEYAEAIIRDLNIILAPYATFTSDL